MAEGMPTDLVNIPDDPAHWTALGQAQRDLKFPDQQYHKAADHAEKLSAHRRPGCARNAHCGEAQQAEDQDRVENDIEQRAHELHGHGCNVLALGLHDALTAHLKKHAEAERTADGKIRRPHLADGGLVRKEREKGICAEQAEQRKGQRGQQQKEQAVVGGKGGLLPAALAKAARDQGVHAHARAHRHRDHQHLDGIGQRNRGQRVLAQPRDKDAVHKVVQRLHQHGDAQRNGHGKQEPSLGHHAHLVLRFLFHNASDYITVAGAPQADRQRGRG